MAGLGQSRFGILLGDRQINRLPKNDLDFCTVVNIFPKEIVEEKLTLEPPTYIIPRGTYKEPGLLKVFSASYWREMQENQPLIEIPVSSVVVAQSLVQDYSNGMIGFAPEQKPGLFFVKGDFNKTKEEHKIELDKANARQRKWYEFLVNQADKLYAQSNGNPLTIAEDMKLAAQELNITERDWLRTQQTLEMVRCKACDNLNRASVIICPNCKVVLDAERFAKLGLKFAS